MGGHVIAGTGHRPHKLGGYTDVRARQALVDVAGVYLSIMNVREVISGMALGWDQALAFAAIARGIPVIAAIPFLGQQDSWPLQSQSIYRKLLNRCQRQVVVSLGGFEPQKMQKRNEWMIDNADRVVALFDGSKGGTANCLEYARKLGKPIDNLWCDFIERMPSLSNQGLRDVRDSFA